MCSYITANQIKTSEGLPPLTIWMMLLSRLLYWIAPQGMVHYTSSIRSSLYPQCSIKIKPLEQGTPFTSHKVQRGAAVWPVLLLGRNYPLYNRPFKSDATNARQDFTQNGLCTSAVGFSYNFHTKFSDDSSILGAVSGKKNVPGTLSLEELAADDFRHGRHLLFLEFLGRDAGIKVVQQLTGEAGKENGRWNKYSARSLHGQSNRCENEHNKYSRGIFNKLLHVFWISTEKESPARSTPTTMPLVQSWSL